jgi:transposase InsO family protein
VDRLTKVAHFIPVKTTYTGAKLAELYMSRIVCLHGVPKKILSDRGAQFKSRFWEKLHEFVDTKINFSSVYHPQTDGQIERTNQILEDMLRACALKHGGSWDKPALRWLLLKPTITATKPALRWLLLKPYIGESVGHHYNGIR